MLSCASWLMDSTHIRAPLAAIPDALNLAHYKRRQTDGPQFAPGLLAFISHACDWELSRRVWPRFSVERTTPAIPPEEMGASFAVLAVLLATFGENSTVGNLLAATGNALGTEPPAVH